MTQPHYTVRYSSVLRHEKRRPQTVIRRVARHAALDALSIQSQIRALESPLTRNRVQFLYLHFVMRDEEKRFRRLIEMLLTSHNFISHSEAVQRIQKGTIDKPYIAVSFDDGFRNCLRAANILAEYGISACFFVCEAMANAPSYDCIKEFCKTELLMPPMEFLSWGDMEHLLHSGHEIGNHSGRHKTLRGLTSSELVHDVQGALVSLQSRLGDVKHFAWPRGRFAHFDPAAAAAVFDAGHISCASAERGCHLGLEPRRPHALCLRRDHVIAAWPIRHTFHFLRESSRRANTDGDRWPASWERALEVLP